LLKIECWRSSTFTELFDVKSNGKCSLSYWSSKTCQSNRENKNP
jgi:hypothetical protein